MNIGAAFKLVMAIATAVPIVKKWIIDFNQMWNEKQIAPHRENLNLHENKLNALQKALKNADTDEDRIALSIILHDINQLPND